MAKPVPERMLFYQIIGYNFTAQYDETVVAMVWLMADSTQQTLYEGHRIDRRIGGTVTHDYGTHCPNVEQLQEQQP